MKLKQEALYDKFVLYQHKIKRIKKYINISVSVIFFVFSIVFIINTLYGASGSVQ